MEEGNYDKAYDLFKRHLEITEKINGKDSFASLRSLCNLAIINLEKSQY